MSDWSVCVHLFVNCVRMLNMVRFGDFVVYDWRLNVMWHSLVFNCRPKRHGGLLVVRVSRSVVNSHGSIVVCGDCVHRLVMGNLWVHNFVMLRLSDDLMSLFVVCDGSCMMSLMR